jgi:hypothetical protein
MSRPKSLTPKYRRHKPTGQAVVRINGRDFYLGKYGSQESRERYAVLMADYLTVGRVSDPEPESDVGPTIDEVIAAYWQQIEENGRYLKNACTPHSISRTRQGAPIHDGCAQPLCDSRQTNLWRHTANLSPKGAVPPGTLTYPLQPQPCFPVIVTSSDVDMLVAAFVVACANRSHPICANTGPDCLARKERTKLLRDPSVSPPLGLPPDSLLAARSQTRAFQSPG